MPSRKQLEKLTAKYMKEIRDADAAKLSLREYLREGLVGGAAGLIALQGMRNFRPFWAHASHDRDGLTGSSGTANVVSPPNTPFQDPLPILPTLSQKTLTPAPTKAPRSTKRP